jgi:hypothetical protein
VYVGQDAGQPVASRFAIVDGLHLSLNA